MKIDKNAFQTTSIIFIAILTILFLLSYQYFFDSSLKVDVVDKVKSESMDIDKIDINIATKEDLMKINGIGDVIATRIITEREKLGEFTFYQQLDDIKGIGDNLLDLIKSSFYI